MYVAGVLGGSARPTTGNLLTQWAGDSVLPGAAEAVTVELSQHADERSSEDNWLGPRQGGMDQPGREFCIPTDQHAKPTAEVN